MYIGLLAPKMDKSLPFEKVQPQWQILYLFFWECSSQRPYRPTYTKKCLTQLSLAYHYKPITRTNHSEADLSDIDFYSVVWFKCTCIFLFRKLSWLLWPVISRPWPVNKPSFLQRATWESCQVGYMLQMRQTTTEHPSMCD